MSSTPPPPPTNRFGNNNININPEKRIAAVYANKHIPKIKPPPTGKELEHKEHNDSVEQNHEQDVIDPAVAVAAAQSKDTNLQNHEQGVIQPAVAVAAAPNPSLEIKEPSPEIDVIEPAIAVAAASNPPLETKEPSPEQYEKIAVAVAAEESKDGNVFMIRPTHEISNNESQTIIRKLQTELYNKQLELNNAQAQAKQVLDNKQLELNNAQAQSKQDLDNKQLELDNAQAQAKQDLDNKQQELNNAQAQAKQELNNAQAQAKQVLDDAQAQAKQDLDNKQQELDDAQENLKTTKNELKTTQTKLKTTQENFKKIQGDRKIVSSDEYKNLTIKFKEYVIYILNEIKDDKNTSSIIKVIIKTIKDGNFENYDINKLKIVELETGVLEQYYSNLPNTLSSRERIKLLIIYILSTYECKEHYNNRGVNIMDLEDHGINNGGTLIKNIYVVCKFLNNFVLDIKNHKEGNEYTYVNELLMSDLQMYYGIPEYFKEKINSEEPKLSDIEKCKMYALYVLQNINLDK